MKYNSLTYLFGIGLAVLMSACSQEMSELSQDTDGSVLITMSMEPFEGEIHTRTNLEGNKLVSGEKIRMKIICPNSKNWENGETWGSFYEFTCSGEGTSQVFKSNSSYEGQATTYIYTAQNTTGTRVFVSNNIRHTEQSNFFYADQSKENQFRNSDVIWAQGVRQTGAREVHLNFKHKVAKLNITIDDSGITPFTDGAILTLQGMPDIDGAEIVVGDYYADETFNGDNGNFYYKNKASCDYQNNGKVIGIEVIDDEKKRLLVHGMTGNPAPAGGEWNNAVFGTVENTGTYTAYHLSSKRYSLYVPPCELEEEHNAVFWIRDGERRYSVPLNLLKFEEGKCYNVTLRFGTTPEPDPTPETN